MSLDVLRNDALLAKRHELESVARSHRAALLEILAVNAVVAQNSSLSNLADFPADHAFSDDRSVAFLGENDVASGRIFNETALTLHIPPAAAHNDGNQSARRAASPSTPSAAQARVIDNVNVDSGATPVNEAAAESASAGTSAADTTARTTLQLSDKIDRPDLPPSSTPNASVKPDAPVALPERIAAPQRVEEAQLSIATQHPLDREHLTRPAKTVHLSPQDVQEQQLRERQAETEQRRPEPETDRLQRSTQVQALNQVQTDLASSPSSTVGAYSAATPIAPQDSPDTSPDSDTGHVEVPPPKDLQPTPEQQHEKEEHDRLLEIQKEIARKQALGDIATPDDQLRWEEREAAAREAEEKAAREEVHGPEPSATLSFDDTEAGQAIEDLTAHEPASGQPSTDSAADPQTTVEVPNDSQAVHAKIVGSGNVQPMRQIEDLAGSSLRRLSSQDTCSAQTGDLAPVSGSAEPVSSQQHSNSGLKESKDLVSPPISPLTQRQTRDNNMPSTMQLQTPRLSRSTVQAQKAGRVVPLLQDLKALQGAAEDPDRDYLEPLFRIQAHEPPNSRTKALPELIKIVPKALSTEDQFVTLHERLDYRILRRIYQLQNANKWSLRQMDRCKEPEPPITHHDHMMAEMKLIRKDFKAERRMKKSVCACLANMCAEWVAAPAEERVRLQVTIKPRLKLETLERGDDTLPDLEPSGESAFEDDLAPPTPKFETQLPTGLVVPTELAEAVEELHRAGKLQQTLHRLPKTGLLDVHVQIEQLAYTTVSKFVEGKVLPKAIGPTRKRSRFDYEDEAEVLDSQPESKRLREELQSTDEDPDCALFHLDNKPIRDRLHSNNVFRPPTEFQMPSISFYEYRQGSQWIWEDDQKLRKLAKDYSFNWSLIAEEMALPSRHKSSAERRTPWECFERWVELESLPADMRKTIYFKTWFQRLEQSQQAAERRYQAQVVAIQQQQAQNGTQAHVPLRRRTVPTRVEKRRISRYLWMVDGFRKLAKKREQQAWKQAEAARAAAQRKSQTETNPPRQVKMTPQEFSRKRHERDLQMQEVQRQHRQKVLEVQQRQLQMAARAHQQGLGNGIPVQQRPQGAAAPAQQAPMQANGQQAQNSAGQVPQQQARTAAQQMPQRNALLSVPPQVAAQGMPQAQVQQARAMAQHPNMQQMVHANHQQAPNHQFARQQYQMPNGNMPSPGGGIMTTQQQLQNNPALLAAFNAQQQQQQHQQQHQHQHQQQQQQHQHANIPNAGQAQGMVQNGSNQQINASPSMLPPPAPQNSAPQQLSSGHVPTIIAIKNQLRAQNPNLTDGQLNTLATQQMKNQSQSSTQARQNAMNAAAGISTPSHANMQAYNQNRTEYPANSQMAHSLNAYATGENANQQTNLNPATTSPQQAAYAQKMWQRQMQQMQMQSPVTSHANLNGSPSVAHASPNMTPASPSMNYSNMNQMGPMNAPMVAMNGQRPPSRSATPQMQRLGSSGSVPGVNGMNNGMQNGMQSPGALQGSPRNMQASMAR